MSAVVGSVQWQGHQGPVSCLDSSGPNDNSGNNLLLSGSEDKTARVWDLRGPPRASLCIMAPGEVFSVKFAPTDPNRSVGSSTADTTSRPLASTFAQDHTVYVSYLPPKASFHDLPKTMVGTKHILLGPFSFFFFDSHTHVLSCHRLSTYTKDI